MDPKDIEAYWKRITDASYNSMSIDKSIGICGEYDAVVYDFDICGFAPCETCYAFIKDPEGEKK